KLRLAIAYTRAERFRDAVPLLDPKSDDAYELNILGVCHAELGAYDEAAASYRAAMKAKPDWIVARDNWGYAHTLRGDYQGALKIHRKVIKLDPSYPWGHYHTAVALSLLGKVEEALPYLERAIALGYNRDDARKDPKIEALRGTEVYRRLFTN